MGDIFGAINNPLSSTFGSYGGIQTGGLLSFLSNVIRLIIAAGGIYAFVNIVIAGFQYISSGSNSDATSNAWRRIYMSLVGLVVMIASFALAAILGKLLFNSYGAILNPQIYGPGNP